MQTWDEHAPNQRAFLDALETEAREAAAGRAAVAITRYLTGYTRTVLVDDLAKIIQREMEARPVRTRRAIPWGMWIAALEEHFGACQRPECKICAEWAGHVAVAKDRRKRRWFATLWVALGWAGFIALIIRFA